MIRNAQILQRLDSIQKELDELRSTIAGSPPQDDWRAMAGTFANDPLFEKAMRHGRQYRRSLRPKPATKRKRRP